MLEAAEHVALYYGRYKMDIINYRYTEVLLHVVRSDMMTQFWDGDEALKSEEKPKD